MRIIEPCCYHKQLEGMIDECSEKHTAANFFSYSDWDMCDLLVPEEKWVLSWCGSM